MDLSDFLPKSYKKNSTNQKGKEVIEKGKELNQEDELRNFLPLSFGKKEEKVDTKFEKLQREVKIEEEILNVNKVSKSFSKLDLEKQRLKEYQQVKQEEKNESYDSEDSEDSENSEASLNSEEELALDIAELPISHEVKISNHDRTVSALSLDRSGTKLITGSHDSLIKLYDFNGMNSSLRPFKSIEPFEGHHIVDLKQSLSGDVFLCATNGRQVLLYDREGELKGTFVAGDQYIFDMRKTSGHIASLSQIEWHPFDRDIFFTSSMDGSIRVWDVNKLHKSKDILMSSTTAQARANRPGITSLGLSYDGKWVAGASQDGSISIWQSDGTSFKRAFQKLEGAHQMGTDTTSLIFSKNGYHLISKGGDDTVKLFDIRNFTKPLNVTNGIISYNSESNLSLSPDEKFIITGTGTKQGEGGGELLFIHKSTMEIKRRTKITDSSVVKVLWHPGINQIITGSGDGSVHILFDVNKSIKGAKLFLSKVPKRREIDDMELMGPIMTPYDEEPGRKPTLRNKIRRDPILSHKPDLPGTAPGQPGKVSTSYTHHIMKSLIKDTSRDEDPREALLKYAKVAEEDPKFVGHAYKRTQPKPIFDEREDELDHLEIKRKK